MFMPQDSCEQLADEVGAYFLTSISDISIPDDTKRK